MCEIFGFFSNNKYIDHEKILKEGIITLFKRGPDSNGIWFNDFLDGPLYEITNDLLSFSTIKEKGIFDPSDIEKIKLDH